MALCACGLQDMLRTSWTNRNLGHRFYVCPPYVSFTLYQNKIMLHFKSCLCSIHFIYISFILKNSSCPFIGWVDPPMCIRSLNIISGLLRTRDALEDVLALKQERADYEEHKANKEDLWENKEWQWTNKLRKYLIIS